MHVIDLWGSLQKASVQPSVIRVLNIIFSHLVSIMLRSRHIFDTCLHGQYLRNTVYMLSLKDPKFGSTIHSFKNSVH